MQTVSEFKKTKWNIYLIISHKINIFSLNETRLEHDEDFEIANFHVIRRDHPANAGYDGVSILISKLIPLKILPEIANTMQVVVIELSSRL